MESVLQLNEFFVEGGNPELSHVLLQLTEPSTPAEQRHGYFFALCELEQADQKHISRLQELIDELENSYYETPDQDDKTALEIALEKTNRQSWLLLKPELGIHLLVGVIRGSEIFFSFNGAPHLLLCYRTRQGAYQALDLIKSGGVETGPLSATDRPQLFSQIVQGKLSSEDYLIAATPEVSNYFSYDRLQKIVTSRPARQSADHLERVLSELKSDRSFGGLIIHLTRPAGHPPDKRPPFATPSDQSAQSLNRLARTEQTTADTLSGGFLPRVGKFFKLKPPRTIAAPSEPAKEPAPIVQPKISAAHRRVHQADAGAAAATGPTRGARLWPIAKRATKFIFRSLVELTLLLAHICSTLLRAVMLLFFIITNVHNRRATILENSRRQWRGQLENFKQLSLVTKILGAMIIAAIILGLVGIGLVRQRQQRLALQERLIATKEQVNVKRDAAESALLYGQADRAAAELQSAEAIMAELNCADELETATCAALASVLSTVRAKLQRAENAEISELADWTALFDELTLTELVKMDSRLYAAASNSPKIVSYNLLTKEKDIVPPILGAENISGLAVPKEHDYLLIVSGRTNVFRLTNDAAAPEKINLPLALGDIVGAVIYNRRLYRLDSHDGQIYKHETTSGGFSPGKPWLKDNTPRVKNGLDLTIDGDMYVLTATGTLQRYVSGVQDDFALQGLYPALTGSGKIWTYNDVTYLYILDPAGRRLIIAEKDGRIKKQLLLSALPAAPTAMSLDESSDTAYVTAGRKLYRLPLKLK